MVIMGLILSVLNPKRNLIPIGRTK
jgi:hypothetical protein